MKLNYWLIILVLALTAFTAGGCSKSPSLTQTQIHKVLDIGSRFDTTTEAGININELRQFILDYYGALNLAREMWPKDLSQNAKQNLIDAGSMWRFSLILLKDLDESNRKYPDLKIKGLPPKLAEHLLNELPERFRGDFPLSDGYYSDSITEGTPKHLSYTVAMRAAVVASITFNQARSELVTFLR